MVTWFAPRIAVTPPWAAPSKGRVVPRWHPAQRRGDGILPDLSYDVSISGHVLLGVNLRRGQVLVPENQLSRFRTEPAPNLRSSIMP